MDQIVICLKCFRTNLVLHGNMAPSDALNLSNLSTHSLGT